MPTIVYDRAYEPTDAQLRSYYNLLRSPQQLEWEYSADFGFLRTSLDQLVADYLVTRRADRHEIWAVEGDRIVGYAGLELFAKTEKCHAADLGFGVAEDRVRQGIGLRVVVGAIAKARELGLKRIEGDCLASNAASAGLFLKAGFTEEGLRRGGIERDGRLLDIRLFGLLL